jgi:hypothetical protein
MFVALPTAGGAEVTVWSALAARGQRAPHRHLGRPDPLSRAARPAVLGTRRVVGGYNFLK